MREGRTRGHPMPRGVQRGGQRRGAAGGCIEGAARGCSEGGPCGKPRGAVIRFPSTTGVQRWEGHVMPSSNSPALCRTFLHPLTRPLTIHAHERTHTHAHAYTHIHWPTHTHADTHAHPRTHARTRTHAHGVGECSEGNIRSTGRHVCVMGGTAR